MTASEDEYVLVVGSAHPDIFADYELDQASRVDKIGDLTYSIGGTAYNIAVNLSGNYIDTALFTVIKKDSLFSELIVNRLERHGVITTFIERSEYMPESGFIGIREEGRLVSAVTASGITSATLNEDTLEEAVRDASLVTADCNLSESQLRLVARTAVEADTLVFIAGVSESKARRVKRVDVPIDVLALNREEACSLLDCETLSRDVLTDGADRHEIRNLVVTDGSDGYIVASPDSVRKFPAPQVTSIVSTSGTGDAFLAGVCHAVTENSGWDWERIDERVSAYVKNAVSHKGSTSGATAKETELSVEERVNQKVRAIAGYSWWEVAATFVGVIGAILTIASFLR